MIEERSDIQAFRRATAFKGAKLGTVNHLFDEYRFGGGRVPMTVRVGKVVAEGPLFDESGGHYIVVSDSKDVFRYFGSRVDLSSWMKYAEDESHLATLEVLASRVEKIGDARQTFVHRDARCWLGPCLLEYSGESEELRVYAKNNAEPIDIRDVPPTRFREAAQKKYSADPSGWVEGSIQEQLPASFLVGTHEPGPVRSLALREPPPSASLVSHATGEDRRWYVRAFTGTVTLEDIAAMLREYGTKNVRMGADFLTFFARPSEAYTLKHSLQSHPGLMDIDIQMVTRQEQDEPDDEKKDDDDGKEGVGTEDDQVDPTSSDTPIEDEPEDEEEVSLIGLDVRFLTNDGEIADGVVTDEEGDLLTVRSAEGDVQEVNIDQLVGDAVDVDEPEEVEERPSEDEEEEEEGDEEGEEESEEDLLAAAELLLIEIEEAVTGGYSSRMTQDFAGSRKAGSDAMKSASQPTGPGSREKCPEGHKKDEVTGLCVPTQEDLTTGMIATYDKPLGTMIRAPFPQKRKKHDDDED